MSARRTIADLRLFGRGYLRNIVGLFFGIIFPVIIITLFGAIFAGSGGSVTVYVQNKDTGPFNAPVVDVATPFIDALNGTDINGTALNPNTTWPIVVQLVDPSKNFTEYLKDHSASDGIIVPENFSLDYLTGQPLNITLYGNPAQSSSAIVGSVANGVVNGFNLQRVHGTNEIQVASATVNTEQTKYIDFLVPGLIGFSILVSPMFSMVNITSEYKKVKLFKQLSLTPLHKMEWLASKVIWYIVLVYNFLRASGPRRSLRFRSAHDPNSLAHSVPNLGTHAVLLVGHAGRHRDEKRRNRERPRKHNHVSHDVPVGHVLPDSHDASVPPKALHTCCPCSTSLEGLNNVMVYGNIMAALVDIAVTTVITVVVFVAAAKVFKWRED